MKTNILQQSDPAAQTDMMHFRINLKTLFFFAFLISAGIGASLWMFWITAHGPSISPDSVEYISVARSLFAGKCFCVCGSPQITFPPVYPALLALGGLLTNGDIIVAAHALAVILFGLNVFLLGLLVGKATRYNWMYVIAAILIFGLSAPNIEIHSYAWSDPLFITFVLATFIFISEYLNHARSATIIMAGLMTALAIMTRYIGIALLPPTIFVLISFDRSPSKHKLRKSIIFSGFACLPLFFWLIRNTLVAQSLTGRPLAVHWFTGRHMQTLIDVITDFVLPVSFPENFQKFIIAFAIVFILAAIIFLLPFKDLRRKIPADQKSILLMGGAFALSYIILLILIVSFLEASASIQYRLLMPIWLTLFSTWITVCFLLSQLLKKRLIRYGFIISILVACMNPQQAFERARSIRQDGRGYTSQAWRDSEILSYLRSIERHPRIYSNGVDAVLFQEIGCLPFPGRYSGRSLQPNPTYESQLSQMCDECNQGSAMVVYFWEHKLRDYYPSFIELDSKCELPLPREFADAVIYVRK